MKRRFSLVLTLLLPLLFLPFLTSCTRVSPGYAGIKINYSGTYKGVADTPVVTGWQFYTPGFSTILEYPTFVQTTKWEGEEAITFNSKEDLSIRAEISVSYQLEFLKVPAFYVKFRSDDLKAFSHGFFHNVTRDMFNEVGGQYSVEGIMGPEKERFLAEVRTRQNKVMGEFGIEVVQLGFIGSPQPPKNVLEQLNAKVAATQAAMRAENEVRKSEAEARKIVVAAEGAAKANIAQADGEAKAAIARAEGQAKANALINQSITERVIEWRKLDLNQKWIEQWGGGLPMVMGAQVPGMLMDLRGLEQAPKKK